MRSRFWMIVSLIILGIGLIGILVIKASSQSGQVTETPSSSIIDTPAVFYTVWFAKQEIVRGEAVTRENFRIVKLPEDEAFEFGVKEDVDINFVEGMVAKKDISTSFPVFPDSLLTPNQDGYFNLIIEPGYVPVPVSVPRKSIVGGVISSGSLIDLLVLTSSTQNLVGSPQIRDLANVSLAPLFMGVKVLQISEPKKNQILNEKIASASEQNGTPTQNEVSLILQLTRKQVAQLTIARNIAQIEVHLSSGALSASELSADSGDILSDYKSVRELRARNATLQ